MLALTVKSVDQPVKGLEMVPEQSRLALMSTWLMTQPPLVWSLNPLCMNESQNSLPCVEVFCAQADEKLVQRIRNTMITILKRFIYNINR